LFQHQQEVLIPASVAELTKTQEMKILMKPRALKHRSSLKQTVKFTGQPANQLGYSSISFTLSLRQLYLLQKYEIRRDRSTNDLCSLQTSTTEYHEIVFIFVSWLIQTAFNPILKEGC